MPDYEPGHVGEAVKEAAAVKAVELVAACVILAVGVLAQVAARQASEPDYGTLALARWAKACERGWAALAGVCWRRAERFRVEYERARL